MPARIGVNFGDDFWPFKHIWFKSKDILIPILDFQAFDAFKLFLIVSDQGTVVGHCGCGN
jgi:hypothetical protein